MRKFLPLLAVLVLPGCGDWGEAFHNAGRAPPLTPITNPTEAKNYKPVSLPMPAPPPAASPDSLWQSNATTFFKDQRASRVGDILTVLVTINDSASLKDNTATSHTGTSSFGIPTFFGLETLIPKIFGKNTSTASLVSATGSNSNAGTGSIARNEAVTLSLAGEITQILPDGNLVVAARQEMEVNQELRVLQVSGIIRPEDITSDNTVASDQMAEARIGYGGTGTLYNVQSPHYGQAAVDALSPY